MALNERQRRLLAIRDAIDADLRRPWKIPELAREAGISRRSFNTHFRRVFGVSAADYLRTRRLEQARAAMIQQGISVNEAAWLAGYGNPANFATAFRKHFSFLFGHDLRANAARLSRGKIASHFFGSCLSPEGKLPKRSCGGMCFSSSLENVDTCAKRFCVSAKVEPSDFFALNPF